MTRKQRIRIMRLVCECPCNTRDSIMKYVLANSQDIIFNSDGTMKVSSAGLYDFIDSVIKLLGGY